MVVACGGSAWVRVEHAEAQTPANPVELEVALPPSRAKSQFETYLRVRLATHGPFARVVNEGEEAPMLLHVEPFGDDAKTLPEEPKWLVVLSDKRSHRTLAMLRVSGMSDSEGGSSLEAKRNTSMSRAAKAIVDAMPRPGPPDWTPPPATTKTAPLAATASVKDDFDETTVPFDLRCLRCSYLLHETFERLSPRDNYAFNKSLAGALRQLHECIAGRRAPTMRFRYNDKGELSAASVEWDRFPLLPEEQNCLSALPTMRPNVKFPNGGAMDIACFDECGGGPSH